MIGNLYCRFDTGSDRQGMNMNPNNNRRIMNGTWANMNKQFSHWLLFRKFTKKYITYVYDINELSVSIALTTHQLWHDTQPRVVSSDVNYAGGVNAGYVKPIFMSSEFNHFLIFEWLGFFIHDNQKQTRFQSRFSYKLLLAMVQMAACSIRHQAISCTSLLQNR